MSPGFGILGITIMQIFFENTQILLYNSEILKFSIRLIETKKTVFLIFDKNVLPSPVHLTLKTIWHFLEVVKTFMISVYAYVSYTAAYNNLYHSYRTN